MLLPVIVLVMLMETAEGQMQLNQLSRKSDGDIQALYMKAEELSLKTKTQDKSLTNLIKDTSIKENIALEHIYGNMRKILEEKDSFEEEMNDKIEEAVGQTDPLTERIQDVVNLQSSFGPSIEGIVDDILQLKLEMDAAGCMDGWMIFNGSCYLFNVSQITFFEAATACTDLGAHLVYVESKAENDFVKGVISKLKDGRFWMGVTDLDTEGTWLYYGKNTRPQFYDWYQLQPDNWQGNEDCVHCWEFYDYHWNDQDCLWPMPYICEKKTGS